MNNPRNIYLNMKTLKQARQILFERFSLSQPLLKETVSVPDAVGLESHGKRVCVGGQGFFL